MKCGLAILLLFLRLIRHAQSSFSFRNISINEGLSQSSVVDIAEDPSGFLWLATQDGLNKYDGKDFHQFQKKFPGKKRIEKYQLCKEANLYWQC
jgi:ligand-binding sensor domain-containing protein